MPHYELVRNGVLYDTLECGSIEEALQSARHSVKRGIPAAVKTTIYVDIVVREFPWADSKQRQEIRHTEAVHPRPPPCAQGRQHFWRAPYEVVGGNEDHPGMTAKQCGVVMKEICPNCGIYRLEDTWATRPDTGQVGVTRVWYDNPDDKSLAYVADVSAPLSRRTH